MNNIIVLALLLSLQITAQEHALKVNPIGFFYNGFEVSYESYIENNKSFEFVIGTSKIDNKETNSRLKLIGFEGRYKIFLKKNQFLRGIYLSPTGTLILISEKVSERFNVLGIGALVGYQFIIGKENHKTGLIFDFNVGVSNYI